MRKPPVVCIVIPCYNEQEVLPVTSGLFTAELDELVGSGRADPASHVLLVNDGSRDRTWEIIEGLSERDPRFRGMSLSRNRGHQNALLAGLMECRHSCDCAISIDCDGGDDISAMGEMVDAYLDGCDVVYGVRSSRETDTAFKRATAQGFYRLLGSMGVECVYNHADYRLMAKDAWRRSRGSARSTCSCAAWCRSWASGARPSTTSATSAWPGAPTTRSPRWWRSPSTASRACR